MQDRDEMTFIARTQKKRWVIQPINARCEEFAKSLRVSPLLAQVLINRGVTDVPQGRVFLKSKLTELIEPAKMPGVEAAAKRIKEAIEKKEKITVYGDYDVDGITGVTILWRVLTLLEADVDYYIPHRIEEGYGLNAEAVETLAKNGTNLLITVDCGITALESANLADSLGLDLIITDHHEPSHGLPKAVAIVHPAIEKSYPNPDSSGSMVAFKLAWAIANEFSRGAKLEPAFRDFMLNATTLAAIGTVADVVALTGENRILTSYGLKALPHCELCGIQSLIESAGLTGQGLDSYHIGFRLAPILNAAGRMGHARLAVELLTTDSNVRSVKIAEYLKQQNADRRQCERKILKQAFEVILQKQLNHPDHKSIVLAGNEWHSGVIGIVASRVVDKYYRPTIIFNIADGTVQGSARSVEGFDVLAAISACSEHLISFGGHRMAAGITIEHDKIPRFISDFEAYAQQNLSEDCLIDAIKIDAEIPLGILKREAVTELERLAPFGQGNPAPIFATKGVRLAESPRRVGAKSDHLQLAVTDNKTTIRCIGFGMGKLEKKLVERDSFSIAYQPQINSFNGFSNVQLVLSDVQFE